MGRSGGIPDVPQQCWKNEMFSWNFFGIPGLERKDWSAPVAGTGFLSWAGIYLNLIKGK